MGTGTAALAGRNNCSDFPSKPAKIRPRFTWAAICASRHEENVAKAMANIITQKDRAAANLRVLTGDLSKCTTVKYSGDDDHTLWAGGGVCTRQ